jgi:acyl-coenzyme A thioesterase PaaI-like protein
MVTLEEIRAALASQPSPECLKLTPFELVDASAEVGFAKVQFARQPAFANHFGEVQGGFAAAVLDVPISAAVLVEFTMSPDTSIAEAKFSWT